MSPSYLFKGSYPSTRLRRTRAHSWVRALVQETQLRVEDLIWPVFLHDGDGAIPIPSMPGIVRYSITLLVEAAKEAAALGIPALALFPATDPQLKTPCGKEAYNPNNLICRAIRALKQSVPEIGIITDVALDPYTTHGHDGLLIDHTIANDATIAILCRQALVQAEAGSDVIAPSDMMDGRIGQIRKSLDDAGFESVLLLSYAAKYASSFYGPFRDAVGSQGTLKGASKATYQMDPGNIKEALREVALDIKEGADLVMVKPGLPYSDIIQRIASTFPVPVCAYQVSGEYAMIAAAGQNGWLDAKSVMHESLLALKRAGSSAIFTYAAVQVAASLS